MAVTEILCFEPGSVKGKKQYQCIAKHEVAITALAGDRRRWKKKFFHASHRLDKAGWELFENGQYNQTRRMIFY